MLKFLLPFILFSLSAFSQSKIDSSKFKAVSISISYQKGKVFQTNDFLGGINNKNKPIAEYYGISTGLNIQTYGKNLWEQFYNYPKYGFGINFYELGNSEEIGNPISLFWNYSAPFKRWEKFSVEYELGLGLAFNWKNYSDENTYNIAIGSKVTLHSNFGVKFVYSPINRLNLSAALILSHFSNGSLQTPNMGINLLAPRFGLSYNMNYDKVNFNKQEVPEFKQNTELLISPFFALKNISYSDLGIQAQDTYGVSYPIYGVSLVYNWHVSYMSKIGIGANTTYDQTLNISAKSNNNSNELEYGATKDNFTLSLLASYDLVFGRISVMIQPSFYVYRNSTLMPDVVFHQRIGIKYKLTDKFYGLVALRANNFNEADYIEWTIMYDLI